MAASNKCDTWNVSKRDASGYLPIENYGMIGNMRTCALVSMDGSVGTLPIRLRSILLTKQFRLHVLVRFDDQHVQGPRNI
jgi:hypothetical protein